MEKGLSDVPFQELVREMLVRLGEDVSRPGLRRTPERMEQSLSWLTRGYRLSVEQVIGDAIFDEDHHSMVIVKDIEMYSMCEHHMLPFFGHVHVAYVPNGKVVGLSKIPRLVGMLARRLQVQERLTTQIADALVEVLKPEGVLVMIEAEHFCMSMRGVKKPGALTVTSAVRGIFKSNPATRAEAMSLITHPGNRL
jgi:GTP cyclohydrolase I